MFPVGGLSAQEDIVHDEKFITEIHQYLADGKNVLIHGPNGTGKSTVAREALRPMKMSGTYVASPSHYHRRIKHTRCGCRFGGTGSET